MNLADTMSALANYFGDALEACGRPTCAVLRYVGMAEFVGDGACDCVCEAGSDVDPEPDEGFPQGSLRVVWDSVGPAEKPPSLVTMWSGAQFGPPVVRVRVRVMRCWPTAEDTTVADWDAAAAGLADDAWCLVCAAQELIVCNTPIARARLGVDGCHRVGGYVIEPVLPAGGCAGVTLTMYAQLAAHCP